MRKTFLLLIFVLSPSFAAISVQDDAGNTVTLQEPARRVVTLAPHTMELVHAAGGMDRIVGKGSHSLYPPTSRSIPEIGDNRQIDIERVLLIKPDLLVLWRYGLSQRQVDQLRRLGIPLFFSDPHRLHDIPDSIVRIGKLLGTEAQANAEAKRLRGRLDKLRSQYAHRQQVRVFYQVSDRPLYTLNDTHVVSEVIRICGGVNVFGAMPVIAPQIDIESVLATNPDVILHTSVDPDGEGLAFWKKFPILKAVQRGNIYTLNPDWLDRPGPRMVTGAEALCKVLERARHMK